MSVWTESLRRVAVALTALLGLGVGLSDIAVGQRIRPMVQLAQYDANVPPSLSPDPRVAPQGAYPGNAAGAYAAPYGQGYGQPAYGQPAYGQPAAGQPAYGQPTYPASPLDPFAPGQGYGAPATQPPAYNNYPPAAAPYAAPLPGTGLGYDPAYGGAPPVLFPGDWGGGNPSLGWGPGGAWAYPVQGPYLSLFQDFRISHEYLAGGRHPFDLGINETEIAGTINFPNFLYTPQPLRVSPGFILDLWAGPAVEPAIAPFTPDLPSRAYAGYIDFDFSTDPTRQIGADLNVRPAIYTDFNTLNTDSFRIMGTGTAWLRLTPSLTAIGGVTYLDRVDIKILPVVGVVYKPTPFLNAELVFPNPRISGLWTTIGNTDVWWSMGGEYGGGSWTIERANGASDRIDINDLRVFGGLQFFNRATTVKGFLEAGYVFNREIVYVNGPNTDLRDTFMIRGGLSY